MKTTTTTRKIAYATALILTLFTTIPSHALAQESAASKKKASAKSASPKAQVVVVAKETKPQALPPAPEIKSAPRLVPGAPAPENATYTGVIIDCTGLGLTSSPSPKLYDEAGIEVYGTISVSEEYLFDQGVVAYPRSLEAAVSHARIGRKPMIIKALRLDKETHSEPVISQEDAKRLRDANATDHFLERCAVVFVLASR
jgi:hypothetical protein